MKKRIHILAFLIISINIFSQQIDTIKPVNSLQKGSWSVQFEIGSDFTLQSFGDVLVSLKYHLSPKIALRFGVGYNATLYDREHEYYKYYYEINSKGVTASNSNNIFITGNFIYYLKHDSKVNIFCGIGPRASYDDIYNEYWYYDGYKDIMDNESWAVGLNAVFGCEWFPVSYLSFLAEYSAYGTYGKSIRKNWLYEISTQYRIEYNNSYSKGYEFRGNMARLGLSVYF